MQASDPLYFHQFGKHVGDSDQLWYISFQVRYILMFLDSLEHSRLLEMLRLMGLNEAPHKRFHLLDRWTLCQSYPIYNDSLGSS